LTTLFSLGQNNGLAGYDDPSALDGTTIDPDQELSPAEAMVRTIRDAAIDGRNALYIANTGDSSIAIYDNPLTASGARMPSRRITGDASETFSPFSVAVDTVADELYLSNSSGTDRDEIRVYDISSPETFDGDIPPTRTFATGETSFEPMQLVFAGGSLYVSVARNNTLDIQVFDTPGDLVGEVTVDRVISNASFETGSGFYVDAADRLIVANRDGETVQIWNGASELDGSPGPDVTITIDGVVGSQSLEHAVTDSEGRLYVLDNGRSAIYVFDDITALSDGPATPDREFNADTSGFGRLLIWERTE
jgi:DNA-binding beta-propeller fold protein YncE